MVQGTYTINQNTSIYNIQVVSGEQNFQLYVIGRVKTTSMDKILHEYLVVKWK